MKNDSPCSIQTICVRVCFNIQAYVWESQVMYIDNI